MTASDTVAAPASRKPAGLHSASWAEARQLAFRCAAPLPSVSVPLREAAGRTLVRPVTALQDLPHYVSAAMDGWAVNGTGPWELVPAGLPLSPGQASTIATGGLVPNTAAAVLRKESGHIIDGSAGKRILTLRLDAKPGEPRRGQHIRPAGTEALEGEVLIPAGTVLNPAHTALAAVAGLDELEVKAKPVVAVVLTGSEVVTQGVPAPGQVRDTFGPQLDTVITQLGGIPGVSRRIGDSFSEWTTALRETSADSAARADVVITTGGTGKSGTDHFRAAVAALGGRLLLDGIAMRPGHPAVLAELADGRFVVGLPGNPLAAMMALTTLGAPLLAALAGAPLQEVEQVLSGSDVEADSGFSEGRGRTRLMPCRVLSGLVFPVAHTAPGMMRGLAGADGVMAVPPGGVDSGQPVPVLPLPWTQAPAPTYSTSSQGRNTPWHA
ncbi:molybdopterin molybdotransferase MoeA [Pseudarthrobacter sp. NamE2]|uniref:molybdopterin molybdotransferase MoeA n=1 Tax=Pseudarthrobacter sp. NamE2 TaxID=2576838 RepID=UPI0010FE1A1F|nr:molybdopterin molybdotransferase MoeA [Pseudarthrobacter sp. NamE2]TLM82606.1 molybdopterin molybdotransferase MoeA [Pseudarthrobacter sp. NamE2]